MIQWSLAARQDRLMAVAGDLMLQRFPDGFLWGAGLLLRTRSRAAM
jgi:hypothetical protein